MLYAQQLGNSLIAVALDFVRVDISRDLMSLTGEWLLADSNEEDLYYPR